MAFGPEAFIALAKRLAASIPGQDYHPRLSPAVGGPICFENLVFVLEKYTKRQHSAVGLDAFIEDSEGIPEEHAVVFTSLRDNKLRERKEPMYLPGRQTGVWRCNLEQVLCYAVQPEQIDQLRQNLHLRDSDCISDDEFYLLTPLPLPSIGTR